MSLLRWLGDLGLTVAACLGALCLVMGLLGLVGGVKPLIFRSDSMAPTIRTNALALSHRVDASALRVGDVVSVEAAGSRITHRITAIAPAPPGRVRLTLKGDANRTPDPQPYVVGSAYRVWLQIPELGGVLAWLGRMPGVLVLIAYAVVMAAVIGRRGRRGDGSRRGRGSRWRRRTAAAVAATTVGTLALAVAPSWAWWSDRDGANLAMSAITLQPPTGLTCSNGTISWTAPSPAPVGLTYKVTYVGSGGVLGLGAPPSGSATTAATSWTPSGGLLTLAGTETVSVQSQLYNWLSTSTGTKSVNITLGLLGSSVSVSCA